MDRTAPYGVISLAQLRILGVREPTVRARVRAGRWYRLYRGVIAVVHPSMLKPEGRWLAAVLACGDGAALSFRSAAMLHGLWMTSRARIEVIVPWPRHPKHAGIQIHSSATLRPQDVTIVRGIPVTTIARTIFDCAGVLTRAALERLIEQAETHEVLDEAALRELIALYPTTLAAVRLRELLDSYAYDRGQVFSAFERRLRDELQAAGLPEPLTNRWIVPDDGEAAIRPDFYWPEHRLVLSADGFRFHRSRAKFERDIRDDQRMVAAGVLPIRVTYRQADDPRQCERVIATVATQLRLRAPGPEPPPGTPEPEPRTPPQASPPPAAPG